MDVHETGQKEKTVRLQRLARRRRHGAVAHADDFPAKDFNGSDAEIPSRRHNVRSANQHSRVSFHLGSILSSGKEPDEPLHMRGACVDDRVCELVRRHEGPVQVAKDLERGLDVAVKELRRDVHLRDAGLDCPADIRERSAAAPVQDKPAAAPTDKPWIGTTITGKGWNIAFDQQAGRTRVLFQAQPTDAQKAAIENAGFYWSAQLNSWNKKLTCKAYRAAQARAVALNALA